MTAEKTTFTDRVASVADVPEAENIVIKMRKNL